MARSGITMGMYGELKYLAFGCPENWRLWAPYVLEQRSIW